MKKTFLSKILLLVILFTMFSSQFLQSSHVSAHYNHSYLSYSIVDVNFISAKNGDENSWWDSITSWFESVGDDFQETGDKIKEKFESIKNSIASLFNSIDDGVKTFSSSESNEDQKAKEINRSVDEVTEEIRKNLKDDEKVGNKGTDEARTLFRGERSSVSPDVVLKQGFTPKGTHDNLELHVTSNTTAGNFISTTSEKGIAEQFAGKNGYVYEIYSSNYLDVNKTLGSKSPFPEQMEFAIPGGVSSSQIKGAWVMKKGKLSGEFIPNSGFNGGK